jgi:hypothetical protein
MATAPEVAATPDPEELRFTRPIASDVA